MELGDRDSWLGELLFDQIAYRTDPVRELRMMLQNEKKSVAYPYALLPQDKANQFRTMTKKFYAGEYDIDQFLAEGSRIISE